MNIGLPISRVAPSGRAAKAGPSRSVIRDMERAARGEEQARATVGRGIQQIGAGVGAIGDKLHNQLVGDQILSAQSEYETAIQKFLVDVDNTRWVEDGIPQWDKILEQGNTKHEELTEGISNHLVPEAKEAFQLYAQGRKVTFDKVLDGKIQGIRRNYTTEIFPLAMMRFARSGDTEAANNFLTQLKKGYFPESEWQRLDKAFDKSIILGAIGKGLSDEHIERMIKEADSLTQQEKTSLRSQARTAQARKIAISKAQYDAYVEKIEQDWLLKLRNHQLTEPEILASKLDVDKKQEWLADIDKQADKILKDKEIVTNESIKGELEVMAYDLSTGAVTMPEFNKRLREEWNKTIDDDAYDEIFSLAERKFESYQAGAMKEREVFALGQLVTHPSELGFAEILAQLTSKFDKEQAQNIRQLQFDNLDRYKKALRDWLKKEENKDADADEIYIKGRSLLKHYRKTPDQLRNPITAGKAAIEAIKRVKAKAEIKEFLSPVNTMNRPANLKEFEETMARLPTRDARMRYYQKWYKDVKDK